MICYICPGSGSPPPPTPMVMVSPQPPVGVGWGGRWLCMQCVHGIHPPLWCGFGCEEGSICCVGNI